MVSAIATPQRDKEKIRRKQTGFSMEMMNQYTIKKIPCKVCWYGIK
jgi:hypothetical protein